MIRKLKNKWQVGYGRLFLILVTFALGGSLTGWLGRYILGSLDVEAWYLYYPLYIIVMTLIWPLMVLLVSIPLGQFVFFVQYLKKMGTRIGIRSNKAGGNQSRVNRIAIFASGAGSNAQKIIDHFRESEQVEVALILYNKPMAGVKNIAQNENIPAVLIEKEAFFNGSQYIDLLKNEKIDLLVLAGFLWKIPNNLIEVFPRAIINIHPALLPAYGGKGMYGQKVHEAVLAQKETFSGITIHYVDEHYDHGDIIFQAKCPVLPSDTAQTLAERIHQLEHANYPIIIESILKQQAI